MRLHNAPTKLGGAPDQQLGRRRPASVRRPLSRRHLLSGSAFAVALAAAGLLIADPFAGNASRNSSLDNGSPTSTVRIELRSLVSQMPVSGTLGYAGRLTVSVPAGTNPLALRQAEQAVASARSQLAAAKAAAAVDAQSLSHARATLQIERNAERRTRSDRSSSVGSASGSSPSSGTSCAQAGQTVASDEAAVTSAEQERVGDEAQLAVAESSLASSQADLADAENSATSYGSTASFTMLPTTGSIVRRGQPLYAIDGRPTLLIYGSTPAWRSFRPGMPSGSDVGALNRNLRALGYSVSNGAAFTSATRAAISALQRAHGLTQTGRLDLGAVVFEPGALRVAAVTPTLGATAQPGPVLTATSTRHDVSIQLDAAQVSEVRVGTQVSITLPEGSMTTGLVTSVGKVATTRSGDQNGGAPSSDQNGGGTPSRDQNGGGGGGPGSPTIDVEVRLVRPRAAGHLDQAPVGVSITERRVSNVLAVPVNALVALARGGYAVEEIEANGTHRLVPVTPGLFDDAAGLVQVTGSGLAVGQRVVVPAA